MTPQEIFDTAARGIIGQGGPSVVLGGACLYRGPNGRKCAAGWLLPDDEWSEEINSAWVGDVPYFEGHKHLSLIFRLQVAHDGRPKDDAEFFGPWREEMLGIAKAYDLSPAILETIK